ncbi:hypothetical protein SEA_PANAMAXUS_85 [Mycobacterium phage Panamaxus]|uniref:Uncharacterized protein n=1 Tax=Mycobacterium phage Veracruz TaxID=2530154 RepID=A0A481VT70_9CAUD|nr:hypothetical protein KIP27_gp06 [Mycobacterium phage Veracruz]AIS73762.1 hypothetical protein PBI_QUINNKIRO_88 [Mycobacterium phage QuinnKiro]ALA11890.1 hypothetical protein SEA_TEXAGE_87 [Mycobacterium phage Texage]AOT24237.1 hypothetical protein SEA_TODACORO_89 [Mycobacterium phage Todacoro]AOT25590.1 hypothetical protein SEA_MARGO_89 [Mycobacterium phage Margo]AUX82384.1 hypothetical protein SEA_LAMBERT1_89 [Mycobacterium phage Lambert1]AVP42999.1 hypothetical protein SEA_PANAMAXUS_85 [
MSNGQSFRNGVDGLHSTGFNWAERLVVIRRDPQSYGVERYLVRNVNGRHGYAY